MKKLPLEKVWKRMFNGSGALGFFNEDEYFYQKAMRRVGFNYNKGMTFVSKTTNMDGRPGNMELTKDYKPAVWLPDCIMFDIWNGDGLNAVGVPTPGLIALLATEKWQRYPAPFFISVMSMAPTKEKRLVEFSRIGSALRECKKDFKSPFGLEPNLSCPNGEEDPRELIKESKEVLEVLAPLEVHLVPKYSVGTAPIEAVLLLNNDPNCSGVCFSNTWHYDLEGFGKQVFGRKISPLARYGGGGVSGKHLRKKVLPYIKTLRARGFTKHIRGGGGIFSCTNVREYRNAGASSCFTSTAIPVRSWLVPGMTRYANSLTWRNS